MTGTRLAALVAVTLLLTGCDSDRRAISRDDLPTIPAEPDHVVHLDDDGFDIDELEVSTDDVVEFRVEGDREHGVRAGDVIDTGLLEPGESTVVIFDVDDTYEVVDLGDEEHTMVVTSRRATP